MENRTETELGITMEIDLRRDLKVPVTLFIREEECAGKEQPTKTLGLRTRSGMEVLAPEGTLTEKSIAGLATAAKALLDPHDERERNIRATQERHKQTR